MTQNDPRLGVSYDEKIPTYEVFKTGQRIYFIIHNPKGFESNFINKTIIKNTGDKIIIPIIEIKKSKNRLILG